MPSEFLQTWKQLIASAPHGFREVDADHPLRLAYGANDNGEAIFFVIARSKPGLPQLSRIVLVERGVRKVDGQWTLSLTLKDSRFLDVFMRLCEDLIERSAQAAFEAQALNYVISGVNDWKHLLRNPSEGHLSLEGVRGLLAELWFGFTCLARDHSRTDVLNAWSGPLGSPQDFNIPLGRTYEVKSVHPDSKSVRISSADQLDVGERPTELIAVTLVQVPQETPSAISLPSIVMQIDRLIREESGATDGLYSRLDALGVDLNDVYYSDLWFAVTGHRGFDVGDDFPAIRASELPAGISEVIYSLALSALGNFEIEHNH